MKHKCFISFKMEDESYKKLIQKMDIEMIDKSLDQAIESENEDYIMQQIRKDYLADSTVTICLIGKHSAENSPGQDQTYIKRELQASLYNGVGNTRNGILGVVLPEMYDTIFRGMNFCSTCGGSHNCVFVNSSTVINEFAYNYYIPNPSHLCYWAEEDRYCVLVKWSDFINDPEGYIDQAYNKRTSPIASKVKVYPKTDKSSS